MGTTSWPNPPVLPGPPTPGSPAPKQPQPALAALTQLNVKDWQTTAAGLLSGWIGTVGPITAYFGATHDLQSAKVCGILTLSGVLARVYLGLLMQDKGKQLALVPGSSEPTLVPSVEMPVNSQAIPVVEGSSPVPSTFQPPTK